MAEDANLQDEIQALKNDLGSLRSDIGDLAKAVREMGQERARAWRSSVEEGVSEATQAARERGRKAEAEFERNVSEHPWTTVLTALGVGFLIAKLSEIGGRR